MISWLVRLVDALDRVAAALERIAACSSFVDEDVREFRVRGR